MHAEDPCTTSPQNSRTGQEGRVCEQTMDLTCRGGLCARGGVACIPFLFPLQKKKKKRERERGRERESRSHFGSSLSHRLFGGDRFWGLNRSLGEGLSSPSATFFSQNRCGRERAKTAHSPRTGRLVPVCPVKGGGAAIRGLVLRLHLDASSSLKSSSRDTKRGCEEDLGSSFAPNLDASTHSAATFASAGSCSRGCVTGPLGLMDKAADF